MIRTVAFDLMDTLVRDPYREALAAAFGDRLTEAFQDRDRSTWPRFETGELTEDEFWAAHADWDPDLDAFEHVRREETRWLPGMRDLLVEVGETGRRVVVASNYPAWIVDVEQRFLDGLVDEVVVSCRIGVRKPDPAFYDEVIVAAQSPAPGILFVDDRDANVQAAREARMQAHLFQDAAGLRTQLVDLGVL